MQDTEQFPDSDRLARFLRESIDGFMDRLDIKERNSDTHDEQVHYEEWVRFCLVTSPAPCPGIESTWSKLRTGIGPGSLPEAFLDRRDQLGADLGLHLFPVAAGLARGLGNHAPEFPHHFHLGHRSSWRPVTMATLPSVTLRNE